MKQFNYPKWRERVIANIVCPQCHAIQGELCRAPSGTKYSQGWGVHTKREKEAYACDITVDNSGDFPK